MRITIALSGALLLVSPLSYSMPFAYVGYNDANLLAVVDVATNSIVGQIGLPEGGPFGTCGPSGVSVSPLGDRVYVSCRLQGTLAVIDTARERVIANVRLGGGSSFLGSTGVALNPAGTRVFVANDSVNTVAEVDTTTDPPALLSTSTTERRPNAVAVDALGRLHIASQNSISVGGQIVGVGNGRRIVPHPDGSRIYVPTSTNVAIINTATKNVTTIPSSCCIAGSLAIDPGGDELYVGYFNIFDRSSHIAVIDPATRLTLATIPLAAEPGDIGVTPDGTRLYVVFPVSGQIVAIDLAKREQIGGPIAGHGFGASTHSDTFIGPLIGPDLTITKVIGAPGSVSIGRSFNITTSVQNQGTRPAQPSQTAYLFSTDRVRDSFDIRLGTTVTQGLETGQSTTFVTSLSVPSGTRSGPYYLIACANSDPDASQDIDSTNDCWISVMPVQVGGRSNIAFLPGMLGSRLYANVAGVEVPLWSPISSMNMCGLKPRDDGSSRPGVFTRDLIDFILVYGDIHARFKSFLATLGINDWAVLPYDWRLDNQATAQHGVVTDLALSVRSLVGEIERLASNSQTGMVTVVGHSNGGLLAKQLITVLKQRGKAHLVDRLVMVGSPQLGTPDAIGTILHGDGHPTFVSPIEFREASETMIGAYNLLPSTEYFRRSPLPVVEFDDVRLSEVTHFRRVYSPSISHYGDDSTGLRAFLLGREGRSEVHDGACEAAPNATDVTFEHQNAMPNALRSTLLDRAEVLHAEDGSWADRPENVKVTQIVGTGLRTTRGIRYTSILTCPPAGCSAILAHTPLLTSSGDGTVVVPSAAALTEPTFYVDLPSYNHMMGMNDNHAKFMGVHAVHEIIRRLLDDGDPGVGIPFVSLQPPADVPDWIRLRIHSPVSVVATDGAGRRTQLVPHDLGEPVLRADIPNTDIRRSGEETQLVFEAAQAISVRLTGTGYGTFTLNVEEYSDDHMIVEKTFRNVPVAPGLLVVMDALQHASDVQVLRVDIQGDGIIDFEVAADLLETQQANVAIGLQIVEQIVRGLRLDVGIERSLTSKLRQANDAVAKGNPRVARNVLEALRNEIRAQTGKAIPTEPALGLVKMTHALQLSME